MKRRSPASRPGKPGDSARDRPRIAQQRREARDARSVTETSRESITESIAASAEHSSQQRLGAAARRAAILAAVVCVLTLTIAGPVRTYFAQRTEMNQLAASEAKLRAQIADLQQQKTRLADPAFIAAQARERLGFVLPGEVPYQVQLPATAATPAPEPGTASPASHPNEPWYTSLWRTVADTPHNVPADVTPNPSPGLGPPPPPAPAGG